MPYPSTIGGGIMGYPSTVDAGGVAQYLGVDIAAMAGAQNVVLSAGSIYCYEFELRDSVIVTGLKYRAGNVAAGHVNAAIYTQAGNIVSGSDTGSITNNSTTTNVSFSYPTSFMLGPGVYWLAFAADSSTDTFIVLSPQTGGSLMSKARIATNTLAAGAMPLTLGALSSVVKMPAFSFPLSGGI